MALWSVLGITVVASPLLSKGILIQHMVITVLLLSSYLVMLVEYSRSIDALAVTVALLTGEPVFAEMPPVDQTFVGLLVVFHGSYLVYKTRSSAVAAPGAGDQQS